MIDTMQCNKNKLSYAMRIVLCNLKEDKKYGYYHSPVLYSWKTNDTQI